MRRSVFWLASLPLLGSALRTRQDDDGDDEDTTTDPFRRRASQSLVKLGDYLYFEGGEISNWFNDEQEGDTNAAGMTSTQVISLAESWTNETVEITILQKTSPEPVKSPYLWGDESTGAIYRFGGARPGNRQISVDEPTLWIFEPEDNGEGEWSTLDPANADTFSDIVVGSGGAFATCGGRGIAAGGHVYQSTDARFSSNVVPLPGVATFNFKSKVWQNQSSVPANSPTGTFNLATGICLHDMAEDPLFLLLGGADTTAASHRENELRSFRNITFYNPAKNTWHWQEASGDIPGGRDLTCAAGVKGKNGTFEIFLYGGRHPVDGSLDDVHILSLPGFQWFKIDDLDSPPRNSHDCKSIGGGQVLVSGGLGQGGSAGWREQDPWRHAMGVFDMGALEWASGYETDMSYDTPQVIRDWYDQGGLDDMTWNDEDVRDMFIDGPGQSPPDDGGDDSNNDGSNDNEGEDSGSSTPVGAIAGGVVGGVVALALIGALVFFLRRRRAKQGQYGAAGSELPGSVAAGTDYKGAPPGYYAELHNQDSPPPVELEQRMPPSELDSRRTAPSEMPTEANERL